MKPLSRKEYEFLRKQNPNLPPLDDPQEEPQPVYPYNPPASPVIQRNQARQAPVGRARPRVKSAPPREVNTDEGLGFWWEFWDMTYKLAWVAFVLFLYLTVVMWN